ncbi:MAG: hypothetical protein PHT59_07710 [Candidatus Omnitrophica bacterium]|nr:hypothetical protein [Candidatus Omnitrophota bacterium]
MAVMTIPEAERWLKDSSVRLGKWGWMPVHKKITKYIREKTKKGFRSQITPDGGAWPKAEFWKPKKTLSVGMKAAIGIDNRAGSRNFGKPYKRIIKTQDDLDSAKALQWNPEFLKKAHKKVLVPALYRKSEKKGIKPATDLYDWINEAGRRTGSGGPVHQSKFDYSFGLHGWRVKYAGWYYGDAKYYGVSVKARPFLGLNEKDVDFVVAAYAEHAMKMIDKVTSKTYGGGLIGRAASAVERGSQKAWVRSAGSSKYSSRPDVAFRGNAVSFGKG